MKNLNILYIIKLFIILIIFIIALLFESAFGIRLYILNISFLVYILSGVIRLKYRNNRIATITTFILEIITIIILEYNTKYVINYSFHFLYLITIMDSAMILNIKASIAIGITAFIASFYKYFYLISLDPNYSHLSEMLFSQMSMLLTVILVILFKYYIIEKKKSDQLNDELNIMNEQLKMYSKQVGELSVLEERSRMARDLHDTLGHNITGLIMQLEMIGHYMKEDNNKVSEILTGAKDSAREALKELRQVVDALRRDIDEVDFINSLNSMINKFQQRTGVTIQFSTNNKQIYLTPRIKSTLYFVIQEALTNAVKHGKATVINLSIDLRDQFLYFDISNNGVCCNEIIEGNGLKGMTERLTMLGGHLKYESKEGFKISGWIPIEEGK